ncbi:MAG TPA: hypothetical protein PLJ29_20285 [Leptospiraceae bacterium]|nr:hypothetical protein [Leptospiraceae bacterium]HNI28710.1 hypothetical protein [Leptospiraceae bacterium]HNO24210.1 hypothetical protein [Leptospiraceae bacterium]
MKKILTSQIQTLDYGTVRQSGDTRKKMRGRIILFSVSLAVFFTGCTSSVEFIPDGDYHFFKQPYLKTDAGEVDVLFQKPEKRHRILGTVIVRDFSGHMGDREYFEEIKKELLQRKLDGVYFLPPENMEIPPWIIQSKNQAGMTMSYTELNKEMKRLKGYAYRYRD